eukprot:g12854.t1
MGQMGSCFMSISAYDRLLFLSLVQHMDPNGTQLESELSQQDTPCLIVEDSQAESVLSEDDPDQSYRNLQARCLSNLQTRTRSPVL